MATEAVRQPWWRQFALITRIQFSDYRDSAAFLALSSLLMPVGAMWLVGEFIAGKGSDATWFLAGNAVMSVAFGSSNFAIYRTGQLRLNKEIDYYATLPVSRSAFVATLFILSQISSLPGLLSTLLVGHWLLKIPLSSIAAGIPLALAAAACLTVVGTAAGALARSWGQVNLFGNLITFLVLFLSPTIRPFERLPLPLQVTSYILPTGQATMALTEAFSGRFGVRFWTVTGLLLLWMIIAAAFWFHKLDWRND